MTTREGTAKTKAKIIAYEQQVKDIQAKLDTYSSGSDIHTRWTTELQRVRNLIHLLRKNLPK